MRPTRAKLKRIAALALATAAVLASAGPSAAGGSVAAKAEGENVRAYWTAERMRNARPAEILLDGPAAPSDAGAESVGRPAAVDPAAPGADATAAIRPLALDQPRPQGHGSYTRRELPNTTRYPNRLHGKVFFTLGFTDFQCSGTVVASRNRSTVISAGHCLHERGIGFATNWMFVPGYRNGNRPFGTWVARKLLVTERWASDEDLRYDIGAAVLKRNGNGQGIQDLLGARGIAFNQPRNQFYRSYGYPAEPPFDGERLYRCDSAYGGADPSTAPPQTMRINCDFTAGSSGGGWVIDDRFVAGLNSYKYDDGLPPVLPGEEPEHMYGPYFGDDAKELYRDARGRKLLCQGQRVTHLGTGRGDVLTGTNRRDVIKARGGDDLIKARKGHDLVCAGSGDDRTKGNGGLDRLRGGGGDDILNGGRGRRDLCVGGPGSDRGPRCERRKSIP